MVRFRKHVVTDSSHLVKDPCVTICSTLISTIPIRHLFTSFGTDAERFTLLLNLKPHESLPDDKGSLMHLDVL